MTSVEIEVSMRDSSPKGSVFHNTCSTCDAPSKYRCPKCSSLSCSLDCVKAHKVNNDCDGLRDKTAFVPMDGFKDSHLHSDYHFLEDVGRTIDNVQRAKRGHGLINKLPHNLYRLQVAAKHRKTNLLILPLMFSKRKISTTYLRYSDRKIFWKIEWKFPLCEYTCSEDRVDEEELLGKCLDKFLCEESEQLMYYQSMGHKGVSVLMRDESCPANITKYLVLKQNKSLKSNFAGKKIIEFPTLLVVPKIHLSSYIE